MGVLSVSKKPKKAYANMTDKQLVRRLFPKDVRKQLKTLLLELNREKPASNKRRKR